MVKTSHLFSLKADSQSVLSLLIATLREADLQVVQSFDLQTARSAHTQCTCPHHGSDECNCQMIVLLVYGNDQSPLTLVAHGKDNLTHVGLINDSPAKDTFWLESILGKVIERNAQVFNNLMPLSRLAG
jgi:hypothetical protein